MLQPQAIQLVLKAQDGSEQEFRVLPSTRMHKVMSVYCTKRSLDPDSVNFLYDGDLLYGHKTVQQEFLEDGDEVQVMVHMVGD